MQNIFSIPIEILQLTNIDNNLLVEYAKSRYDENCKYSNCSVYDIELQDLNKIVKSCVENFSLNYVSNEGNIVDVKKVWVNIKADRSITTPHAHRDSFLSAVYYPKAEDGELVILNPFAHSHLSHINPSNIINFNEYNSENFSIPIKTGMLIIFNSMLVHYVNYTDKERISIAYDINLKN
jgi:uncharacterized protein (TIGR02466 family)